MNCISEFLGMGFPESAAISTPYREPTQNTYEGGKQIVSLVDNDIKPSDIMSEKAFINAIVKSFVISVSTNASIHINVIAKSIGVEINNSHSQDYRCKVPLLLNCQPAVKYLGEDFYRAGRVGIIMSELIKKDKIFKETLTVNGKCCIFSNEW